MSLTPFFTVCPSTRQSILITRITYTIVQNILYLDPVDIFFLTLFYFRSDTDAPVSPRRGAPLSRPTAAAGPPSPGDVVFNTNEQKTATVGRVPRVNRMSSFYGEHNMSRTDLDR
jgi:hypothetical protein